MASNGTPQSWLYQQGAGNAPQVRDRSMEQYYSGSGNPNLPMWNSSGPSQTGAGGQGYGYNRYIPPMMQSWNGGWNTPQTGAGSPYSYNTPNSYGTNYWGGNTYQPMQTSPYGNQFGGQVPMPQFSGFNDPRMSQFGRYAPRERLSPFGQGGGGYLPSPEMYQDMSGAGRDFRPQWATKPYAEGAFGRKPMLDAPRGGITQANAEPAYSPQFAQFLGMGY